MGRPSWPGLLCALTLYESCPHVSYTHRRQAAASGPDRDHACGAHLPPHGQPSSRAQGAGRRAQGTCLRPSPADGYLETPVRRLRQLHNCLSVPFPCRTPRSDIYRRGPGGDKASSLQCSEQRPQAAAWRLRVGCGKGGPMGAARRSPFPELRWRSTGTGALQGAGVVAGSPLLSNSPET